jgi:hypothetical protein
MKLRGALLLASLLAGCASPPAGPPPTGRIRVSADGKDFVDESTGRRFLVWGVNYDHDPDGRLLEDYWEREWRVVEEDFREIRDLGANVVRIHLQLGRFMSAPDRADEASLGRLSRLLRLAEDTGLRLDVTGLGCYHKKDVPPWYDALEEAARWEVQALFWEAVARTCRDSRAVFCYDLMNEPIIQDAPPGDWLAGELGGKHFVQRISRDAAGRSREMIAAAWVERLVSAIRRHDPDRLVTVGVIPWALTFPKAKPIFYSPEAGRRLDFVSVHVYPQKDQVDRALEALAVYDVGKPVVVEETFPLSCSQEELLEFIERSRPIADGWVSFYWGRTIEEYAAVRDDLGAAITGRWLEAFRRKSREILGAP